MSDIVERLREASVERQQIAWGRIDGGQEWSIAADLADQAAGEIERLRSENALHASRYEDACSIINRIWALFGTPSYAELNGRSIYDLIAGTQKENAILRARVAELEAAQEWRPIETLKESIGEYVLLSVHMMGNRMPELGYRDPLGVVRSNRMAVCSYATHWLPLPAPPKAVTP